MASYEIRWEGARHAGGARDLGPPLVVRAQDWMEALGLALERYGLERRTLERAVCLLTRDGTIDVADPDSGSRFVVRQVEGDDDAADPPSLDSAELLPGAELLEAPPPHRLAAAQRMDQPDPVVLEQLSRALSAIPAQGDAARRALAVLDALLRVVPAESASVLRQDDPTRRIHFLAVRGPAASALRGVTIPAGRGIVGVVIRTGTSLLVREAERSPDHYDAVDTTSGYRTRSLLACPVQVRGRSVGAIELLNPFGGGQFSEAHRRAAELAARRMAALLST